MKTKIKIIVPLMLLASLMFCSSSFAQMKLPTPIPIAEGTIELMVADGSSSGTYQQFMREIAGVTEGSIRFTEVKSSGAIQNLDLLVNNKAQLGFMHSDVIWFRSQRDNLSAYKTLLPLFKEEVHFVTLAQSHRTTGGTLGFGKSAVVFNNVSDLRGYKVGAAGGGFITAQVINQHVNYEVVQFQSGKDVMAALSARQIDAAVFVGGAPLPNLVELGPEYKILPISDQLAQQIKGVYTPTSVTYTNMSPESVATVAADCLLIGREYKTPKFVNALRQFRKLFYTKLIELQETTGTHPKWQEVKPDNGPESHGKWPWMELN